MRTLPSFQEKSIQNQSVNRFPAATSTRGDSVLVPGEHPASVGTWAAPPGSTTVELPGSTVLEGHGGEQDVGEAVAPLWRAAWVAGDAAGYGSGCAEQEHKWDRQLPCSPLPGEEPPPRCCHLLASKSHIAMRHERHRRGQQPRLSFRTWPGGG